MIIVGQSKTIMVNFDHETILAIDDAQTGRRIGAIFDDREVTLGKYKSKKRAKEIMKHIYSCYSAFELYKAGDREERALMAQEFLQKDILPFVVEMPEK